MSFFGFNQVSINDDGRQVYKNRFGKTPEEYDVDGLDSNETDFYGNKDGDDDEYEFEDDFSELEELYNEGFGEEDWGI